MSDHNHEPASRIPTNETTGAQTGWFIRARNTVERFVHKYPKGSAIGGIALAAVITLGSIKAAEAGHSNDGPKAVATALPHSHTPKPVESQTPIVLETPQPVQTGPISLETQAPLVPLPASLEAAQKASPDEFSALPMDEQLSWFAYQVQGVSTFEQTIDIKSQGEYDLPVTPSLDSTPQQVVSDTVDLLRYIISQTGDTREKLLRVVLYGGTSNNDYSKKDGYEDFSKLNPGAYTADDQGQVQEFEIPTVVTSSGVKQDDSGNTYQIISTKFEDGEEATGKFVFVKAAFNGETIGFWLDGGYLASN